MTFITTSDGFRRAMWLRLFGTGSLPVKSDVPRLQVVRGEWGETVQLAYDLDTSRLHPFALQRFADYATKRTGHEVTVGQVDGYPIRATRCEVVNIEIDEAVDSPTWEKRPFSFLGVKMSAGAFV